MKTILINFLVLFTISLNAQNTFIGITSVQDSLFKVKQVEINDSNDTVSIAFYPKTNALDSTGMQEFMLGQIANKEAILDEVRRSFITHNNERELFISIYDDFLGQNAYEDYVTSSVQDLTQGTWTITRYVNDEFQEYGVEISNDTITVTLPNQNVLEGTVEVVDTRTINIVGVLQNPFQLERLNNGEWYGRKGDAIFKMKK